MAGAVTYYKTKNIVDVRWHVDAFTDWTWKEDAPVSFKDEFQFYKQRSYQPYVKRIRPPQPLLSPTSQRQVGWRVHLGLFDLSTKPYNQTGRDGRERHVTVNNCWKNAAYPALALDYCSTKFPIASSGGEYAIKSNPEAFQEAQTECLLDLKNQTFNLSITTAEAGKTASWLASRATGMVHILKGIKKGNWSSIRKGVRMGTDNVRVLEMKRGRLTTKRRSVSDQERLKSLGRKAPAGWSSKDVSDRYLEVHYAVAPLIGELSGLMYELSKLFDQPDPPELLFGKGKCKRAYTAADTLTPWKYPSGGIALAGRSPSCSVVFDSKVYHSVTAIYRLKDEWQKSLANAGISSGALAQAGYEILPWSFVLDWGVGIGDYLGTLDANAGVDFVTGWYVMFCVGRMTDVGTDRGTALISFNEYVSPSGRLRAVTRSVLSTRPQGFVTVKSPFSVSHLTTAAALCRSLKSS